MKKNMLDEFLSEISPEVYSQVSLNIDIANKIADMLKARHMTQREFAAKMGKKESEISRWLTGVHGFNTNTLSKISDVLGEPVIYVEKKITYNLVINYSDAENSRFKKANKPIKVINDQYSCFSYSNNSD